MTPTAKEIVQSYRRLYRHGLQAVQYSSPARYVLRDRLQRAYRDGTAEDFNAEKIEKTIEFLSDATKVSGIEHLIVKNLHHVWWWEKKQSSRPYNPPIQQFRLQAFHHFDMTVQALNDSMGTCIPMLRRRPRKMHSEAIQSGNTS